MDKINSNNKQTIYVAILVAVLTYFISSFASGWNRVDDILTRDEVQEIVVKNGEDVLNRSKAYTMIQIDAVKEIYNSNTKHLEKMIDSHFQVLNERLDRIDERVGN